MQERNDLGQLPIEHASPEYLAAVERLGSALAGCEEQLMAGPPVDRRRLRLPDECWSELQQTVAAFVCSARAAGAYPERVLVQFKGIANTHAPTLERESALRDAIIRLCITSYFSSQ